VTAAIQPAEIIFAAVFHRTFDPMAVFEFALYGRAAQGRCGCESKCETSYSHLKVKESSLDFAPLNR
jgi:hypothetical protein